MKPYTFENLTESLTGVVAYDWKRFFDDRINRIGTDHAPLGGLEAAGYRLEYSERMGDVQRTVESVTGGASIAYSIGLRMNADGEVVDVLPEMVAAKAGMGPGMKITAVNGHQYSGEVLRQAIRDSKSGGDNRSPRAEWQALHDIQTGISRRRTLSDVDSERPATPARRNPETINEVRRKKTAGRRHSYGRRDWTFRSNSCLPNPGSPYLAASS